MMKNAMTTPFPKCVDIAIIGGGINGCGCASDAALRGLSVVLCEQEDLASETSSASSKLIHGGLRYLEQFDFSLVKHALKERQRLLELAPYLVKPLSFVIPSTHIRSNALLRIGLFLYDHMSKENKLPHHKKLFRHKNLKQFSPLLTHYQDGYSYYDAQTEDSRLVVANALQARTHGAHILTHTRVIKIDARQDRWELLLKEKNGCVQTLYAKTLINASGASVQSINQLAGIPSRYSTTLIQGTHLIVPRWYAGDHAYLLQNPDKRVVFVIPYQEDYTLIGTTETVFQGPPHRLQATPEEIDYLLQTIGRFFNYKPQKSDILHVTCGARTLVFENKDPRKISRDWVYDYGKTPLPYVSIYSGKLTTYRQLSTLILNDLTRDLNNQTPCSTDKVPLPGAQYQTLDFKSYEMLAKKKYAFLGDALLKRYLRTYGTLMEHFLDGIQNTNQLGLQFSETLYQAEVDYLFKEEWASCAEDILWRRTKLGLSLSSEEKARLEDYCSSISFNTSLTSTFNA